METVPKPKNKAWLWALLSFVLIFIMGYLTGSKWSCMPPKPKPPITVFPTQPTYERKDSFIHDTIVKYIPVNVSPQTDYNKPLPDDDQVGITIVHDTVYVINTKDSPVLVQKYAPQFLKNYPNNPKLLRNKITKDSVRYDFLMPDGYPRSLRFPIDLNSYEYTWEMGSFKAVPLPRSLLRPIRKLSFDSYTYISYNPLKNGTRLALDGTISYGRFGLYGFGGITTNQSPKWDIGLGIRLRNTK